MRSTATHATTDAARAEHDDLITDDWTHNETIEGATGKRRTYSKPRTLSWKVLGIPWLILLALSVLTSLAGGDNAALGSGGGTIVIIVNVLYLISLALGSKTHVRVVDENYTPHPTAPTAESSTF